MNWLDFKQLRKNIEDVNQKTSTLELLRNKSFVAENEFPPDIADRICLYWDRRTAFALRSIVTAVPEIDQGHLAIQVLISGWELHGPFEVRDRQIITKVRMYFEIGNLQFKGPRPATNEILNDMRNWGPIE